MKKIVLILILILIMPREILAGEIDSHLKDYELEKLDTVINGTGYQQENFSDLTKKVITGEFDFLSLPMKSYEIFMDNLSQSFVAVKKLFLLVIMSGVLKILVDSFQLKDFVSFYISFLLVAMNIFVGFKECVGIAQQLLQDLLQIVQAALPFVISLVAVGGHISAGKIFSPTLFLVSNLIIIIINFFVPAITMFASIQIINNMTGRNLLTNFAQLIKNLVGWALKIISMSFMGILSLQRISFPLLENAVVKTAKFAVNSVPLVGEIFSGAVGSVISWACVVKNGASVALLIVILFLCMVPVVKLGVWVLLYKIFAALVQPITDDRIIKSLEAASDACILLLSCCFSAIVIFIFAMGIFISI